MFDTANLKVGDRVGVIRRRDRIVTTVAARSPTGFVTTAEGLRFNPRGNQVGGGYGENAILADAGETEARIAADKVAAEKRRRIGAFVAAAEAFGRNKRNGFGDFVGDVTADEKAELIALINAL